MRHLNRVFSAVVIFGMICACESGYSPTGGTNKENTAAAVVQTQAESTKATVNISFSSDPSEVEIWIDGTFAGVSPKNITLEKSEKVVSLEFKKDGYISASQQMTPNRDIPVIAKLRAQTVPAANAAKTNNESTKTAQPPKQEPKETPKEAAVPEPNEVDPIEAKKAKIRANANR